MKITKVFNKKPVVKDDALLTEFIKTTEEVKKLRAFSPVEKVQFDHEIAISHLYHSSNLEGSKLNQERLNKAIHA